MSTYATILVLLVLEVFKINVTSFLMGFFCLFLFSYSVDAWTLAFSPDSQYLATGNHVGKVNIFGVESGKKEYSLDTRGKFILSIAYVRKHCSPVCFSAFTPQPAVFCGAGPRGLTDSCRLPAVFCGAGPRGLTDSCRLAGALPAGQGELQPVMCACWVGLAQRGGLMCPPRVVCAESRWEVSGQWSHRRNHQYFRHCDWKTAAYTGRCGPSLPFVQTGMSDPRGSSIASLNGR